MLISFLQLLRRCFALAAPYGRRKLALVLAVIFANGLFQVIGVTSIFPFFALAADPARVRNSRLGIWWLGHLPQMSERTLLVWAGIASIALLFLSNAVTLAGEVIRTRYGHGLGHFLRTRLMEALSARPYGYFLERNSGALMQKLVGDVMQFITGIFLPLMECLSRLLTLALLLFTVFLVQPAIALGTAVLLGGFYGTIFLLLRRRSQRLGAGIKQANRGTMIAAQQFLSGIKPILVHDRTAYFTEEFARHSAAQARLYPWLPIYGNGPRYLVEPIAFGGLVAVVVWLAAQGRSFSDILPNLTVIALASYRMLPSVQILFGQLTQIHAMSYIVGEIETEFAAINAVPSMPKSLPRRLKSTPIPFNTTIRLENITFSYPGSKHPVLRDFCLEIPKNSSVGIIGTTGCGKSTLVDIILGLHRPQCGAIRIDDQILTPSDFSAWRAIIGYVPQDNLLEALATAEWRARPWKLTFYGSGPDERHIGALVKHFNLESKVEMGGFVRDLREIWGYNHLLVLPTAYEGLSLALIESMFCGRPALVTRAGGNAELVRDGMDGFVSPGMDPEIIRETLERAWAARESWQDMGRAAFARVDQVVPKDWAAQMLALVESAAIK
jgi:ABC-type multidrug transport system fused ATPase/permease subunit